MSVNFLISSVSTHAQVNSFHVLGCFQKVRKSGTKSKAFQRAYHIWCTNEEKTEASWIYSHEVSGLMTVPVWNSRYICL